MFRDANTDGRARQIFFDAEVPRFQVVIPDFGTVEGPFQITALEYAGSYNGEATYELSMASAGALIFVAAKKENRFCLPNTRFLIHQPSGGIGGTSSDMMIQAEQVRLMRDRLNQIFADATGQSVERIEKDTQRDFWLNTQEALDYGLLGQVIRSVDELK